MFYAEFMNVIYFTFDNDSSLNDEFTTNRTATVWWERHTYIVIMILPCLSCEGWQQLQHQSSCSLERNLLQQCWHVTTTGSETMMSGFDWLHLPWHADCLLGWTWHQEVWGSALPWQPRGLVNAAWHCPCYAAGSSVAHWVSAGYPTPVRVVPTATWTLQHISHFAVHGLMDLNQE